MKINRFAPNGSTPALLTGCGGLQPPIGAPGAMPQSRWTGILLEARLNLLFRSVFANARRQQW